ncbi:MAG: DUF4132 domain-containing protein [Oscillospiraceae bacterium]|nr:DUF4132 domain-containing protein [Oscillospiraceae bacterium]
MNAMIDQLMEVANRKFTDEQIRLIGGYLTGQEKLGKVSPIFSGVKLKWYSVTRGLREIARECAKEPKLLPRVGRYLVLIHGIDERLYINVIAQLQNAGMSFEQLFLESELDESWLLEYIFCLRHMVLTSQETLRYLEIIAERNPRALREFAKDKSSPGRLPILGFLAGRSELPKAGLFGDTLNSFTKEVVAAATAMTNRWALEAKDGRNRGHVKGELHDSVVFDAILLAGSRVPAVNALARHISDAHMERFILLLLTMMHRGNVATLLTNSFAYERASEKEKRECEECFAQTEAACQKMGIMRGRMCAYIANQMLFAKRPWRSVWEARYKDTTRAALEFADPATQVQLNILLEELGEPMPAEKCEELCMSELRERMSMYESAADVDAVLEWFIHGGGRPDELPRLEKYHQNAYRGYQGPAVHSAILSLPVSSDLWVRYLWYIATLNSGFARVTTALQYMGEMRGQYGAAIAGRVVELGGGYDILCGAAESYFYNVSEPPVITDCLQTLALHNPDWVAQAVGDKQLSIEVRLRILSAMYDAAPGHDPAILIAALGDSSKKIRECALDYLRPRSELIDQMRPLTEAKKKGVREAAEQLIVAYEGGVGSGGTDSGDASSSEIAAYCTRNLPKNAANALVWALPGGIPTIRLASSSAPADEKIILFYLHSILASKSFDLPPKILEIRAELNADDLNALAIDIYEAWLAEGAPAKQKAAVLFYGLHARDAQVTTLVKQIEAWAGASRGALASDAARALALGGSDLALMSVDAMARKFKNKAVRKAAGETFGVAAAALGVTPEALGDRIIPTLGFDLRGEKIIDYGTRQFTALLTPALSVELRDATGKKIASLPKPGVKDDAEVAERAKAEFVALKKSLKAVVQAQSARLEQALAAGRYWDATAWEQLFVRNPIMHSFATGLVWGVYEGHALRETFRYMEDGTLTTSDECEFSFDEVDECRVGLVHPLDMNEKLLALWRQQFDDYDIKQPLVQLGRPVFLPQPGETRVIERFAGKRLLGVTLLGKLQKADWFKGSVQDAGGFNTMYREIGEIGAQLYFTHMYVSPMPDEVITVGQLGFYKAGSIERGSYVYDDVKADDLFEISTLPRRLFSEIILDLTNATGKSTETDDNWRSECEGWKIK